jgi:glycosyltransferase involved in cell wall biosynthesis
VNYPRVSAICITDDRTHFLTRAIACFIDQDYPNKELIVAFPEDDDATATFLQQINHPDILSLPIHNKLSLGAKRNHAIRSSHGFYFCCWDDDDWYHPSRISEQVGALVKGGKHASALGYVILYDATKHAAYLSFNRPWEQTILCERRLHIEGIQYGDLNRGEDSLLIHALLARNTVEILTNPLLYVYNFHGGNTSKQSHWDQNIFRHGKALSAEANDLVLALQRGESCVSVSSRLNVFIDELIR